MQNFINAFPGYEYVNGQNMYRGIDVGKGGYVFNQNGIFTNVALIDIQSMHPHSIISLNLFGEYTQHYKDMLDARIAIKHGEFDKVREMMGGKLAPYLDDESKAKDLSNALKTALNSCYGLTAANFQNPMRDVRNKNNIVALKGALLMKTLQDEVQARGFTVCHIKTDSIKIANATKDIIDFAMDFVKPYGYKFEHEATYERMCLVNGSTYIAKYATSDWCQNAYGYVPDDNVKAEKSGEFWTATAKQFQVPYVFKTLFSKEPIEFKDLCEAKEVKSTIYIDMNEDLPEGEHDYHFIGRIGDFCPIKPGCGGGVLVRESKSKDGTIKYDSITGTLKPDKTPYRWLEAEAVKTLGKEGDIDKSYYRKLVDDAIEAISQYGDFERFVADEPYSPTAGIDFPPDEDPPWYTDEELKQIQEAIAEAEREDLPFYFGPTRKRPLNETDDGDAFAKR